MRLSRLTALLCSVISLSACTSIEDLMPTGPQTGTTPQAATATTPGLAIDRKPGFPPYAMMKGTVLIAPHGAKRTDYYYWLNEKNTEKVLSYLEQENKYAAEALAHTGELQHKLRDEIQARAAAIQGTPPFKDGAYWYYERYAQGADFPVIARRKGTMASPEEILLDAQQYGPGHDQFVINNYTTSPDGSIFAYAVDYSGDRWHNIILRDMRTGANLKDQLKHAASDLAFSADNKSLFYIKLQPGTARSYRLMRHVVGTDAKTDKLVFEEKDQEFELSLSKSKGGKVLLLSSTQTNTSEVFFLDTTKPDSKWTTLRGRTKGVLYDADEIGGQFYIRTNANAPDNRIMTALLAQPSNWTELVPEKRGVYIESFEVVRGFIALDEWSNGGSRIRVRQLKSGAERLIDADAPAGHISFSDHHNFPGLRNLDADAPALRYAFSSPAHPEVIYDYDLATGTKKEVQRHTIPGFDSRAYEVERIFVASQDGKQIPVTITYRRDKFERGKNPVLIYGYGAYGSSNEPVFKTRWPSLMDRGFVLAYAHVRGGREMGDAWYQGGKLRNKKNTFTDFIAVAEQLGKTGVVDAKRVFAMGRSAGGLLMGAIANMRPDLFKAIVTQVPFVDVVSTMLDDSIPLTTFEYDEWGNPAEPGDYSYMLSYSPYDQVERRAYPAILVTTGYNDSQVGYFEPAKWVAKIRRLKTDSNALIFRTNMTAGHSGDSGRFGAVEESAMIAAFLLDQAGLNPSKKTADAK